MNDIDPIASKEKAVPLVDPAKEAPKAKRNWRPILKVGGIATATLVIAGFGAHYAKDSIRSSREDKIDRSKQPVVRNIEQYRTSSVKPLAELVVLHAGAKLRESPTRINSSWFGIAPSNVNFTVPTGKELLVVRPMEMVNPNNKETWNYTTKPGDDGVIDSKGSFLTAEQINDNRWYFQAGALKSQNDKKHDYIDVYPIDPSDTELKGEFVLSKQGQYVDAAAGLVRDYSILEDAGSYKHFLNLPPVIIPKQ